MLIYDEFRRDAASGKAEIAADDFVTAFGRRIFEVLCELENSEGGYAKTMLGQFFEPAEMGRIERIEQDRRRLSRNDREVFLAFIEQIKKEKQACVPASGFDDLKARQELLKKSKAKQEK